MHEGPNSCGPTIQLGLRYMWAYCTIGPNVLGAHSIVGYTHYGPTCIVGPHVQWAHMDSTRACIVGLHV